MFGAEAIIVCIVILMGERQSFQANLATTYARVHTPRYFGRLELKRSAHDANLLPLIEGDESGYSAYVPELPAILVTGESIEALKARAAEAIRLWWEENGTTTSADAFRSEVESNCPFDRRRLTGNVSAGIFRITPEHRYRTNGSRSKSAIRRQPR